MNYLLAEVTAELSNNTNYPMIGAIILGILTLLTAIVKMLGGIFRDVSGNIKEAMSIAKAPISNEENEAYRNQRETTERMLWTQNTDEHKAIINSIKEVSNQHVTALNQMSIQHVAALNQMAEKHDDEHDKLTDVLEKITEVSMSVARDVDSTNKKSARMLENLIEMKTNQNQMQSTQVNMQNQMNQIGQQTQDCKYKRDAG
jgi:hypothetical protein